VTFDGDLKEAIAPLSVTLVLDREIDISRGDLIAAAEAAPTVARSLKASLVWMDARPLDQNRRYLLKHTSHTVPAYVTAIDHRVNLETMAHDPAVGLKMNDISGVSLQLLRPIALDLYRDYRATGALILIDAETNATVAAGMLTYAEALSATAEDDESEAWGRVTAGEREARWGHRGGVLEIAAPAELVDAIERSLFAAGAVSTRIETGELASLQHLGVLSVVTDGQTRAGLISLVVLNNEERSLARAEGREAKLDAANPTHSVAAVHQLLRDAGIFLSPEGADL
jgi:hypothetical protein